MRVIKFGGSSVGSAAALRQVLDIVQGKLIATPKLVVVVSALQGITDSLLALCTEAEKGGDGWRERYNTIVARHHTVMSELALSSGQLRLEVDGLLKELEHVATGISLLKEASSRTKDLVASFGERLSAVIVADLLRAIDPLAESLDSRHVVLTDSNYTKAAVVKEETYRRIAERISRAPGRVIVATGFIGSTAEGATTTLGRGGSDYSAALFGAALRSDEIEIWTDVDGVLTADPRRVKRAFSIPSLSYEEAMELSHFGAKVIYPPTIQPALDAGIPVRILNTFNPKFEGTVIARSHARSKQVITGISSLPKVSLLRVEGSGMVGVAGVSSRLFGALARRGISVILISQASSEHSICFAVSPEDGTKAVQAVEEEFALEIKARLVEPVVIENDCAIVAVVGEQMRHLPGVAGRMFQALGKNDVNIRAIAQGSSELNISAVISAPDERKAVAVLHDAFFLSGITTLHLFLIGTGSIAQTLLSQLASQAEALRKDRRLEIKLAGVTNSKHMAFNAEGIPLTEVPQRILEGTSASLERFIEKLRDLNLPNSVVVDCSASEAPAKLYPELLRSNVSVVTPNKKGCSSSLELYREIQSALEHSNVKFFYETNVGAALPILSTLSDLTVSGDRVRRIEAALSGTLGFLCSGLMEGRLFSELVREAKSKGYTEPDPRDDLSGKDVARKLLILGREMGLDLEFDKIQIIPVLPEVHDPDTRTVDEFMRDLPKYDAQFTARVAAAKAEKAALKFVGQINDAGVAKVGISSAPSESPFYQLQGTDNMIAFFTDRYSANPLVIRGPGAGREVTAAGVFADIVRVGSYLA